MLPERIDVLVVGAGPAGSRAASRTAEAGLTTVLIDAKVRIGEQPHCGEFVPARLFSELDVGDSCVIQKVDFMETWVVELPEAPSSLDAAERVGLEMKKRAATASPGYLIDRVRFDRDLARLAAERGATVVAGARLEGIRGEVRIISHRGERFEITPRIVVAADGAASSMANKLGLPRLSTLHGLQAEVPLLNKLDRTIVFLSKIFFGGYAWLFPKGNVANVGLGVAPESAVRPAALLDRFLRALREMKLIGSGYLARYGGLIPVSGLRSSLVVGNTVFAGDAAGLTHPITGAGIPQAIFSGELAGTATIAAAQSGDLWRLSEYEKEIRGRYEGVLKHAVSKRQFMLERWDSATNFVELMEQTWIGFKGYGRRVKST
jgi:digeranylgeranylglycerophospholipid reductase